MSVLVTSPFTHISSNIHSHRAAQGAIYADQLESTGNTVHLDRTGNIAPDINAFTEMYVYHGNDWGGSLNLFGGMKNYSGINNLIRYSQFTGTVYSLWIDHPKYSEMLEPRMAGDIHPDWHKVNWENLKRIENTAVTIKNILSTNKVVIGDSHAISLYRTGWHVKSIPFKTLHGALKEDLNTLIDPDFDTIEFYFGNIDNRHHLNRQDNPELATRNLANTYHEQLSKLADIVKTVSAYELLPIENESRALPKTGYYKGTPFFGSWQQRENTRLIFKEQMQKLCASSKVQFIEWVQPMINGIGELDFKFMEKPKSVHLSRQAYPHWQGEKWSGLPEKIATIEDFFA